MKVRSGEYGSPEDVKPVSRAAKRKDAAETAKVFAANEDGSGIEDVRDAEKRLQPYNREQRGEAALEAALEHGRDLRDNAMDKVAPLLSGIRSRIASFASRAWGMFKSTLSSGFGFGAEVKDAVAGGVKDQYEGLKDFAGNYADMVAPHEELSAEAKEEVMQLDFKIQEYKDALPNIKPNSAARELVITQIKELEAKKAALQKTSRKVRPGLVTAGKVAGAVLTSPVTLPVAAAAGLYKGGEMAIDAGGRALKSGKDWAGGKLEQAGQFAVDKINEGLDYVEGKETKYKAVGLIAGEALSKIFNKELHLTYAQTMALGAALESSGIAAKLFSDAMDSTKSLIDGVEAGAVAMREIYRFIANPETRAILIGILEDIGVDLKDEIEAAARNVGAKALKGAKNTAKVAGAGAAGYAAGTVGMAAAPAALSMAAAAAPVVLPVAAGGAAILAAGYGARRAAQAGAQAVRTKWAGLEPQIQAAVDQAAADLQKEWAIAEPQIQAAIDQAVRDAQSEWKKLEPSLIEGIASTVAPVIELAANIADAPADLKREVNRGIIEMNALADRALAEAKIMRGKVDSAMDIARKAMNEMRRTLVSEAAMAENPSVSAGIDAAIDAKQEVEELPMSAVGQMSDEEVNAARAAASPRSGRVVPVKRNIKL